MESSDLNIKLLLEGDTDEIDKFRDNNYVGYNCRKLIGHYRKAIRTGNDKAMNALAFMYYDMKKYIHAKYFYNMAIKRGNNSDAMNNLGYLYENVDKDYDKAKKYYLMAIASDPNCTDSMNNFSRIVFLYSK